MAKVDAKVVCTRIMHAPGMDYLREHVRELVVYDKDQGMPQEELLEAVKGASAIVCMLSDKITKEVIEAAGPSLKCISTLSVGFNHIDIEECKKRGIKVGNTPGVLTNATADLVLSLLLATCRLIPRAVHEAKTGGWGTWKPMWLCGTELAGKTVGIIGMGRIGSAVGKRLRGFEIGRLLYSGRSEKPSAKELQAEFVPVDELLRSSDIVIATCALAPETTNIFNAEAFAAMKESAILVNAARGACLDQDALVTALKTGQIKAAGLDVTTPEPLPPSHELFSLDNCVILPHIGSATEECRSVMAVMTAENAVKGITGEDMPAQVC
jgi:glyoxylate/hydroxypyruvate reductase